MIAAEILGDLGRVNLAAGAAIAGVIALRRAARARFGARLAYGLWLLPVLAGAAVLVPARQVVVVRTAAPVLASAHRVHQALAMSPSLPAAASLDPGVLLIGLWLVGVAGAALVMALLQHRFMRRARGGGIGPAVVGVIAPRIVTPADFRQRYSDEEQTLVLAHEQAHIARQDSRLNGLSALVQCLCWFNPLVHLAARMMRVDQELACDEAVVARFPQARRAYAEVLMKAQLATLPLPLGCYWPPKAQHPLVERVAMLKSKTIGRTRRVTGAAVLAMLCTGAGVAAWAAQPADVRVTVRPVAEVADIPPGAQNGIRPSPSTEAEAADVGVVVRRIVIHGAGRTEEDAVLSALAITPGQTVTKTAMKAAMKRLSGMGLIASANLDMRGGDLVVRVREKLALTPLSGASAKAESGSAAQSSSDVAAIIGGDIISSYDLAQRIKLLAATKGAAPVPEDLAQLQRDALRSLDDERRASAITISADAAQQEPDQRSTKYAGNVDLAFDGHRMVADTLIVGMADKVTVSARSARSEGALDAVDSLSYGVKQMTARGHVFFVSPGEKANADQAVYDLASNTITFSGNAVVVRGETVTTGEKLVLDLKAD